MSCILKGGVLRYVSASPWKLLGVSRSSASRVQAWVGMKTLPIAAAILLLGMSTASSLSVGDVRPTVVVAGATGKAGSAVVRSLVESGGVNVCHAVPEPQPSRPQAGLLLTRASLALAGGGARAQRGEGARYLRRR